MKKVVILGIIAAVTVGVSAKAETVRNRNVAANQARNQCFVPTDYRGYGYTVNCDRISKDLRTAIENHTVTSVDLAGGGGGGGGGNR